jgi:hypothetical protein
MRPESFTAFHRALQFGPGQCPSDLFAGTVPAIVRGLKVHANNIAHARHVALEETYPRLVRELGREAFHAAAETFLDDAQVLDRSLDAIGFGFESVLNDPVQRDVARAEWAWLESFHAVEANPFANDELAIMQPERLLEAVLTVHPAAQCIALEYPQKFKWDTAVPGSSDHLLLTRPHAEVRLRRIEAVQAELLDEIDAKPTADLLTNDLPSLIMLVSAGAILMEQQS